MPGGIFSMNGEELPDRYLARESRWLWAAAFISSILLLTAFAMKLSLGFTGQPSIGRSVSVAVLLVVAVAVLRLLFFVGRMWMSGVAHPLRELRRVARQGVETQLVIVAGIAIISVALFALTFLKSMIASAVPFWADPPFHATDQWLGISPAAIGKTLSPWLRPIGIFYAYWHLVNLLGIIWVIHWRNKARGQFVLAYLLTWSIGMALAFAFSSAGPIFTGTYPKSLAPQSVAMAVDYLLANYRSHSAMIGGGISAFPSLHVAIAAWFALVLAHRGWRWVGIAYAAAVWACSIILGWHYAVDGLAGILIALGANRLSKWTVRDRASGSATAI